MNFITWLMKRQNLVSDIGDLADDVIAMRRDGEIPSWCLDSSDYATWYRYLSDRGGQSAYLNIFHGTFMAYQQILRRQDMDLLNQNPPPPGYETVAITTKPV